MSSVFTTLSNLYGNRTSLRETGATPLGTATPSRTTSAGTPAASGRVVADSVSLSSAAAGFTQAGPTGTAADAERILGAIVRAADQGLADTLKETSTSTDPARQQQVVQAKAFITGGDSGTAANPFAGRSHGELAAIVFDESGTFTMAERISAYAEVNRQEDARFKPVIESAKASGDYRAYYREALAYYDEMSPIEQAQMGSGYRDTIARNLRAEESKFGTLSTSSAASAAKPGSATGKSFADVTDAARAALNQTYADMKAEGSPFDPVHATQAEWDRAFGQLDRRSLYAVASNSGGKFTRDEQDIARSMMARQQGQAMGLYDAGATATTLRDPTAAFAKGIRFLDSVSPEEKASMDWKAQRASLQWSYETTHDRDHRGEKKEDFTIGDPLVNVLVKAFHSMETQAPRPMVSGTYVETLDDLKKLPVFDNGYFASELNDAVAQYQAQASA